MTKYKVICIRTQEAISTVTAYTEELAYMKAAERKRLPVNEFVKIYEIKKYDQNKQNQNGKHENQVD